MDNMTQLPLINEKLFKQHSPVTSNTDITEFVPYIGIAQELHIANVLGEMLMSELCAQIASNTLSEVNSNLILKIAPALSFYAVYQALPFHWATIVNKGITIRESENSKGIDIKDLAQLRQWVKNDADLLKAQLVGFLSKNSIDYPLWLPENHCSPEPKFDSGFYFRD
ncbi:hypothetical protein JGH11_13360 [Dysgonomonas sp. Marseille-P4677]|uniref:DUF6712 family protein n=1 Tax=Dysgonomonas sp. Marseille-P4677 TaxID=2364790 RepID=UPI001912D20E|nr:DUF6712 family protein [Dysgonomonas sp. Marseille-P4677]MBK5721862.1 hypothetical protein [Dysgonomonas sp. Marseille-P4677]